MAEGYTPFSEFDQHLVGETLGAAARTSRDLAFGEGAAFSVADGKAELEAYPAAGVARVTTETARVELFQVPRYSIGKTWVVFEHGDQDNRAGLVVADDGKVSYRPFQGATESTTTAETTPGGPMATPTSEEAPKSTQVTTAEPVETEERPAITMAGRIGRDPWFSRAEEVLIAGFPLAVNGDQGETTWHNIKARGEVAEAVEAGSDAGHFGTGKQVTVTGVFAEPTGRRKPDFEATSVIKAQPAKKRSPRQPGR